MPDRDGSVLTIVGSARADGNTAIAVRHLSSALCMGEEHVADLLTLRIEPFRYGSKFAADDFHLVAERMAHHQHIVFATPNYWYAMSGLMKVLFDRFTDLLVCSEGRKVGRSFAGRDVWLLATGADDRLPRGFDEPFALTAAYFAMRWRGAFYVPVRAECSPTQQALSAVDHLVEALREAN